MRELRSLSRTLIDDAVFCEKFYFQNGQLPLEKDVIEMMLFQLSPVRAGKTQRSKDDAASVIAHGLIDHWIHCNLYTLSHISVKKRLSSFLMNSGLYSTQGVKMKTGYKKS